MNELDDIIKEFLIESHENLDQLDRDLLALEKDPANRDRLSSIFRSIHTIKGTCGFFGFARLEGVTHVGENLLSRLRDGVLVLNPEITSALLALVDAVREILARIERTGQEGDNDYRPLIELLARLQSARPAEATPPRPELPAPGPARDHAPPTEPVQELPAAVAEGNIRVDVGLLDRLMNLVGELVLARNQILQFTAAQKDAAFQSTSQRLNLITSELQEGVMKTRMQPIGNVWDRLPRVVRDLATACGKQVRIDLEGKETELDRTIIEAIKDPLTHLVRNAVDHGIEPPDVRVACGKAAEGRLFLRAFHEGGQVHIEITDDGAGIAPERIKQKALEAGLVTPEQAAQLSERECLHFIFLPGFSTAAKVTNVSGRGVGMDVVKTNIEKISGTIDIRSQVGQGTTVKIKIPLTLAIIPALIVTSGGDRYALAQVSLLEVVRLEGAQARGRIEQILGTPVYRLRGNLLPLVYLDRELRIADPTTAQGDVINIVVLQADGRQFGLVVQGIKDTEEIVVKPLGKQLKGIPLYAGATILGDGRVALILDVLGIAQRAGVVSEVRDHARIARETTTQDRKASCQTLLLFGADPHRRMAIPLALVARLEEIPTAAVEWAGGREVVQYRGQILPLVRLAEVLGISPEQAGDTGVMQVVVYREQGRSAGLVIGRILDIVEATLEVQPSTRRAGILGSAVIQGNVTDLVDVRGVIDGAEPTSFESPVSA